MELLSPAGNIEKLKYAINYGAAAVYAAGRNFGLRAKSTNFSKEELIEAVDFCHSKNKKIYITVNIFAHNSDIDDLPEYLKFLQDIKVDALIISDPAVFSLAKEFAPQIPIHISTQANVTSWKSAEFWYKQGAKRIILARELTISEIREIHEKVPEVELEMFVHGAMCMSYSGRCLLSSYLNARSANQGECTQPCRWEYHLSEPSRPGEFFNISEDEQGTYLMNSKDLRLIERLLEIRQAGISSIKIEGRMKSLYYVANATRIYREALGRIEQNKSIDQELIAELDKISHRHYSEAFFDVFDSSQTQYHGDSAYIRTHQFLGNIIETSGNKIKAAMRAKFKVGDEIEIIFPNRKDDMKWIVDNILDEEDNPLEFTKPNTIIKIILPKKVPAHGILRKKVGCDKG
ncbi:MAG: U32 family peptidase [Candidatus Cloacimonetes bacterium]|nr:U32 family peptidase [Candidatus Cloacimonadota bacterium]MCF7813780.1 U32 family peptidase [Candidatus Cloacimonadota bacterium]MCF7868348.1 U32 family peptidase [Candidatus Cloacimonadota bacterium]MCF7883822.1 U32 family peptidase [Candidatus Cloacimonadota bacterium]